MALEDSGHCPLNICVRGKVLQPPKTKGLLVGALRKFTGKVLSILSGKNIVEDLVDENLDLSKDCFVKGVLRAAHETILRGQVKRYRLFWNKSLVTHRKARNKARWRAERTHNIDDNIELHKAQAGLKQANTQSKRITYRSSVAKYHFRKNDAKCLFTNLSNRGLTAIC
ncbi:hypothetical protein CDAR_176511 [Caerostris darwini]|uniref:Uncharacterized protein n=1 Tax=Caerostris darwini TaxID=1538125 RepID=A0AAV4Q6T5_9ARAC|nr:hypothetical protein CDAR_176511 [Caerostris darwini]